MSASQVIQVDRDGGSAASDESAGMVKKHGAPPKCVWQYFKRSKNALEQEHLNIALHYDTTASFWDGDVVTLEADASIAPIGNDEDAA
ncbi:hypothetical protein ABBQ38_006687 [Trebouxia sp. C0009 RCD-2024]